MCSPNLGACFLIFAGVLEKLANFSKTPAKIRKHAPKLGEHTVEILKEAGIDQEIIEEMISSRATLVSD